MEKKGYMEIMTNEERDAVEKKGDMQIMTDLEGGV